MILSIIGNDILAAAVRQCCERHFQVEFVPEHPEIFWYCEDTPLSVDGQPDSEWVMRDIRDHVACLDTLGLRPLILVSAQMPVGTTARLEKEYPNHAFAYQPENIRVASAVADFENQARVVVGVRDPRRQGLLGKLFAPFTQRVIFTDPETAEMCKHALNCWLGMNIAFANEMAKLCAKVGADMTVVTEALRSERRVSPNAPLKAGAPFGGGHLARDIFVLNQLAEKHGVTVPIISHIAESNGGLS